MKIIIDGTEYECVASFRGKGRVACDVGNAMKLVEDYLRKNFKGKSTRDFQELERAYNLLEDALYTLDNN